MNLLALWHRYEELKRQLASAQEAAIVEDEAAELARATAAVARMTAPLGTESARRAVERTALRGEQRMQGGSGGGPNSGAMLVRRTRPGSYRVLAFVVFSADSNYCQVRQCEHASMWLVGEGTEAARTLLRTKSLPAPCNLQPYQLASFEQCLMA